MSQEAKRLVFTFGSALALMTIAGLAVLLATGSATMLAVILGAAVVVGTAAGLIWCAERLFPDEESNRG